MTKINLLEDVAPASNEIGALTDAIDRVQKLEKEIESLREEAKGKEQTLRKLTEQEIPDLMTELNVKNFTLTDGSKVGLVDIVSASIPSAGSIERASGDSKEELYERQQACFDWLRKNGGGELIKSMSKFNLEKAKTNRAQTLKKSCVTDKFSIESLQVFIPRR